MRTCVIYTPPDIHTQTHSAAPDSRGWLIRQDILTWRRTPCGKQHSASSATIVKLVIIIELQTAKGAAAKGLHYDLLLWADIELGMAIFAASAAALRPLLRRVPTIWDSYITKGTSGSSSRGRQTGSLSGSHGATGPYVLFRGASAEDIELGRHGTRDIALERTLGIVKMPTK